MKRILIIGQAPAAVAQKVPYDTTMLYQWLEEIGISKEKAQEMFIFNAIYNKFPGYKPGGGHMSPSLEQCDSYWPELETKIQLADKVWVLGNIAWDYISSKPKTWSCNAEFLKTIHPSKMNFNRYKDNKETILKDLREFIYGDIL